MKDLLISMIGVRNAEENALTAEKTEDHKAVLVEFG